MSSSKEDTLSPDELRKRLYQTFKNKGVLDTLKVSFTTKVQIWLLRYLSLIFILLDTFWSASDTAAESAYPGVKTPTSDWRRTSPQASTSKCWIPVGLRLQQHSCWPSLRLRVWVHSFCVLPWKWPAQRQGEHAYCINLMFNVASTVGDTTGN